MARWAHPLREVLVQGIHAGGLEVKMAASGRLQVTLSLLDFVVKIDLVVFHCLACIDRGVCLLLQDLTVEH